MPEFIHLRAQSDYSLGQSMVKIPPLVQHCLDYKMPAICLADQGNLFASLEFAIECSKHTIKPIIGCVLKLDYNLESSSTYSQNIIYGEVLLIAKNSIGYQNLLKLVSNSFLKAPSNRIPHVKLKHLLQHHEGIVLLCSDTKDSPVTQLVTKNKKDDSFKLINILHQCFKDNFFIELVRYSNAREKLIENYMLEIAYNKNIPIVASNPISYLNPNMIDALDALLCISESRYLLEDNRNKAEADYYFKSPEEMKKLFADLPEAIENTILVATKCSVMPESRAPIFPKFSIDVVDEAAELCKEANIGLSKRISNITDNSARTEYFDRLNFELKVINNMKFAGYFLIVSDFIRWSKANNIPVGPGRGSGAGSIVAWSLEITDLDPIHFGLLFERFLNPERISMPDFDIDFCQERRDEVINYVRNKYGADKVAQIITFGKLQARAVLRDVGRVLQMPYGLIDKICKMVPNNPANPVTLKEAIALDKELRKMQQEDNDIDRLLTISLQLEGINRHVSTHAAGIVIADRPIIELAPLYQDSNSIMPVVQYSLKYVEIAGLLKFDFLGLKTLTAISQTCNLIKQSGKSIDIARLPLNDKKTYQMLSRAEAVGVFQFESASIKEAIKNLKPDCLGDLIDLTSLNRPGPMDNIPSYINRKHGLEKIDYIHPKLQNVLQETYGIIIYQEQVMQIAQILAGYSLAEADLLRRAMGKKNKKEMEEQKEIFISRSITNGIEQERAREIFALLEKFASYGFNKAHAASYALISYQTAYLKAHYPQEFFTASINLEINDTDKIYLFCAEALRFNIKILPPDINYSYAFFNIENQAIRFGLAGLKNVGVKAIEVVCNERKQNGLFTDVFNLIERCGSANINKRTIESLAKAGAFSSINKNQRQIAHNAELIVKHGNTHMKDSQQYQITLFGNEIHDQITKPSLVEVEEWNERDKLEAEFEALGFYLSSHPLAAYQKRLDRIGVTGSQYIDSKASTGGVKLQIAGVVISKRIRSSKKGKYAFLQISDRVGIIDVSIFNENLLYQYNNLIVEGKLIFCEVEAKRDNNGLRIVVEKVLDLHTLMQKFLQTFFIYIKEESAIKTIHDRISDDGIPVKLIAVLEDGSKVAFNSAQPLYLKENDISYLQNLDTIEVLEE